MDTEKELIKINKRLQAKRLKVERNVKRIEKMIVEMRKNMQHFN